MLKKVFIVTALLGFLAARAQYAQFPQLQKLFDAGNYDKCIKKSEGYAKNKKNSKEPIPHLYIMKSWLAIADMPDHEGAKTAVNKALNAATRTRKKDKENILFTDYQEDFDELKAKAFEKAAEYEKDDKCSRAIKLYKDINELYNDRLSNYRRSVCMLKDDVQEKDGFVLLRNTMLGVYKDYKTNQPVTLLPEGFALLSKEYLARNYPSNAEDVLRKGMEVFPGNAAIREELLRQTGIFYNSYIASDINKDLYLLRNKLLWADSNYRNDTEFATLLKTVNGKILTNHIKYNIADSAQAFIMDNQQRDSITYGPDSINHYLMGLYGNTDVRRVEGALDNLTRIQVKYNADRGLNGTAQPIEYVFNLAIKNNNYELAAYFIKQAKALYKTPQKQVDVMQLGLENKLIELLAAAPAEVPSLALAKKFRDIAPGNKKLLSMERGLYYQITKAQADKLQYSLFFLTVAEGLRRFPADVALLTMKKEMVIKDYKENFLPNRITDFKELKVVYHIATCTPGKVDSMANLKFTRMLNYVRRQAGMYDSCFLDAELNEIAQQAALMMKARNDLDHSPDSTWKCYTRKGRQAASSSNLSLGNFATNALLSQLEDEGQGNGSAGHRRWILNPYNKVFGHGSTDNTMALCVFGKYFSDPEKNRLPAWNKDNFVTWPPQDFAPEELVAPRWSFSLDDADFGKATIAITLKGKKVSTTKETLQQGYGLNTLVWRMNDNIAAGNEYTVTISNVYITGQNKPLKYTYKIQVLAISE